MSGNIPGALHEDYSYKSGVVARVRELLRGAVPAAYAWCFGMGLDPEDLQGVAPGDLRELIAALMTHNLRLRAR